MKNKLFLNTSSAFLLQVVTIVSNFLLIRLYILFFDSEINGLVQSIAQFLGFISLCELGVGQVIQTSLYKPLAEKDMYSASCVVSSGKKFFRRIAYLLCGYILVLIVVFPVILGESFEAEYVITLIVAMSINSFAQYYFGIIDTLVLSADQRNYICSVAQILCTILNVGLSAIFILYGFSMQMVKLVSSVVLVIKPIAVHIYVRKIYCIQRKVSYVGEPIVQKWNGIAQHVASYVLSGTDIIVLTLFSTLSNVSVYSVYNMITNGINLLIHSVMSGVRSYCGRLWALQDMDKIRKYFKGIEIGFHSLSVFLYTCTGILIIPFVRVYTQGVISGEYIQPFFSFLIVLAYFLQGIRIPYTLLIHVAGKYKQTQNCYIVSTVINVVVSISLVTKYGLTGVALGTVGSLLVQVLWIVIYDSRNILKISLLSFGKICLMDCICIVVSYVVTKLLIPQSFLMPKSYLAWFLVAILVALIAAVITIALVSLFYGRTIRNIRDSRKNQIRI